MAVRRRAVDALTADRPIYVHRQELDEPHTEGELRVRAFDPELVWLAHEHGSWRPRTDWG